MEILKNDIVLRKEGQYWTLYVGAVQCGCGDFDDMLDLVDRYKELIRNDPDEFVRELNDFR